MTQLTIQQAFELAVQHHQAGRLGEAEQLYRQILAQEPKHVDALHRLGVLASQVGRHDVAVELIREAIAPKPNLQGAHYNLGRALVDKGQSDEAITAYRQAIALNPSYPEAFNNMGNLLRDQGQLDEAIAAYRTAVELRPDYAGAYNNLGNAMKSQGQLDDALQYIRKAIALQPQVPGFHSNLIYTLDCHADYGPAAILEECRRWAQRFESPLHHEIRPHDNDRDPLRRLKIGYVSPDIREHAVGRFLLPLLPNHDPRNVETYCYASVRKPDNVTGRLRQASHVWRDAIGWNDAELAKQVRSDGIDVLVDLTWHTGNHRLLVFARKPAPVQVTYLGYCSTTGMQSMDYRLSDRYMDPPGVDESVYSERTVRLAHCFWCYPEPDESPPIGRLPALENRTITFGCFNNFSKITAPAIQCWIELMHAVPRSRLVVHSHQGGHRQRFSQTFANGGIDPSRLQFTGIMPVRQYLEQYGRVDIALDPFPYGGGTTTCDSLWMGVPVITLLGDRAVGRSGVTLLSNVGLDDWIAHSADQYFEIAQKWACDLPGLAAIRQDLRQRMLSSPLMDGKLFAQDVEAAYRQMWEAYCASGGAKP